MICKIRWEERSQEQRDGAPWTEEQEWEDVQAKTVSDTERGSMDFSKQRVTDLKTCRRINIPDPRNAETETILANMKGKISAAAMKYIKEKCDERGNIKERNITSEEAAGLRSLKKRIEEEEITLVLKNMSEGS